MDHWAKLTCSRISTMSSTFRPLFAVFLSQLDLPTIIFVASINSSYLYVIPPYLRCIIYKSQLAICIRMLQHLQFRIQPFLRHLAGPKSTQAAVQWVPVAPTQRPTPRNLDGTAAITVQQFVLKATKSATVPLKSRLYFPRPRAFVSAA